MNQQPINAFNAFHSALSSAINTLHDSLQSTGSWTASVYADQFNEIITFQEKTKAFTQFKALQRSTVSSQISIRNTPQSIDDWSYNPNNGDSSPGLPIWRGYGSHPAYNVGFGLFNDANIDIIPFRVRDCRKGIKHQVAANKYLPEENTDDDEPRDVPLIKSITFSGFFQMSSSDHVKFKNDTVTNPHPPKWREREQENKQIMDEHTMSHAIVHAPLTTPPCTLHKHRMLSLEEKSERIMRVKGNIEITRALTETIIPSKIKAPGLCGKALYDYMDKLTLLNWGDEYQSIHGEDNVIRIFDYNFCDKETGEKLYCVATKQVTDAWYPWKMLERLFTFENISKLFGVTCSQRNETIVFDPPTHAVQEMKRIHLSIRSCHGSNNRKLKWNKIPVILKKATKQRFTLSISPKQFEKKLASLHATGTISAVPILVFDDANRGHSHIEYIHLVSISDKTDIGIAYKYNDDDQTCSVSNIVLDKEYIIRHHQLLYPHHGRSVLDGFHVNIDSIHIGNPDDKDNIIKNLKPRCQKLKDFIKSSVVFFESIARKAPKEINDALSVWIAHSKHVFTRNTPPADVPSLSDALEGIENYDAFDQIHIAKALWSKLWKHLNTLAEIEMYYANQATTPWMLRKPHPVHLGDGALIRMFYKST